MSLPTLRLLIPSFNRACQLECLLRSLHERCPTAGDFSICAFYRYTDADYAQGYEIVKQLYPKVEFVEQDLKKSFKQQISGLIGDCDLFGTFCDDMVVIDEFQVQDRPFQLLLERKDVLSLSLRLDAAKTFSQPAHRGAMPPACDKDLIWRWKRRSPKWFLPGRVLERVLLNPATADWQFSCALDGNVYRTSFFRPFFETVDDFENIPFLEPRLETAVQRYGPAPFNMVRYPRTRVLCLAMNSVDVYHDYPSLGLDPRQFNARFLAGGRLDYTPFAKIVFHACHIVTDPFWLPDAQPAQ